MNLIISNSSQVPIYEQIKNEIKRSIIDNELKENEMLPSIRNLAKDLRISVLTVKKAYDELEMERYVKTVHGKGSFVMPRNSEFVKEEKIKEIEEYIGKIIDISKIVGIPKKEVLELFEYLYGEEE
ncbi:MAG: GntR family transcriptional regulator [Clostridia bacterium]|nr:GntR family transcriptional regulator [Clostridia bacterium]